MSSRLFAASLLLHLSAARPHMSMPMLPVARGSVTASIEKQAIGSIAKNSKPIIERQAVLPVAKGGVKVIIEQQANEDSAVATRAPSGRAASAVSWADMSTEVPNDASTEGPKDDSDEGAGSDVETVSGTSRTSKSRTSSTKSTGRKRDRLERQKKFLEKKILAEAAPSLGRQSHSRTS